MTAARPPLMESKKVLAAARPPAGLGPRTSDVLRGLSVAPPPPAVLIGFLLAALAPLGLLAAAVVIVIEMSSYGGWYIKAFMVMFTAVTLVLAGLAWRGAKRTVHIGEYDGALFVPRLATAFCVVAAVAGAKLALIDGDDVPWTFALPFVATAVLWLPALAFARPSAKSWPDEVLLHRGLAVHSEEDAQVLLATRPHTCWSAQPIRRHPLAPVTDRAGQGWAFSQPCAACRQPMTMLYRLVPPDRPSDAGGSDRVWLALEADRQLTAAGDVAGASTDVLHRAHEIATTAARSLGAVLATIPTDGDTVPRRRRNGRILNGVVPDGVWTRAWLTEQLARWQGVLASVDGELAGRTTGG